MKKRGGGECVGVILEGDRGNSVSERGRVKEG